MRRVAPLNPTKSEHPPGSEENPVLVFNDCPRLIFKESSIQTLFFALGNLENFASPLGELSVAFLEPEPHRQLHVQFHNNPEPTDVITFQADPTTNSAGEICVSPTFAATYVKSHGGDFAQELTLYLLHGWLHLCGIDDQEELDRRKMRKAESFCMTYLREIEVIPHFYLKDI